MPTNDGAFVVGEPQGAPGWFPANDTPNDKATYTIRMTVPAGLTAVGNGRLLSQRTAGGKSTFVWRESEADDDLPGHDHAGQVPGAHGQGPGTSRCTSRSTPQEAAAAKPVTDRIPEIIAFEQSVFGPYPFETVGAIVDHAPNVGYALESQTKPNFDSAPDIATLAHELAHQWYGDSVSLTKWQDIWLNEGFATYAEWLWSQHTGGRTPQQLFDRLYATPASDQDLWTPPTGDPGGPANIFGTPSYDRGAMTLQVLRNRIGDRAFFTVLRSWATQHRYGHGTTAQFIALSERVSHQNLDGLFQAWLFTPGKPGFTR